jgi:hypothetical protein
MVYSILTEAQVKGSVADLQPTERAYSVFWTENGNLEGWTTILALDIVGVWNGFLFGTKRESTTGELGPTNNFTPIDALANERIFFRLKYDRHPKNTNATNLGKIRFTTISDPIFNDEKSVTFEIFPDGKWHFYEINVGEVGTWVGSINNIRFFPCINGARNDEFFLNFFEIGSNNFTFSFENPRAGSSGRAVGVKSLSAPITVQKDVNDKLIVNIDDYGDVRITLTPQTAPPEIIARDISLQLGKVGIGGYIRAEAFLDPDTSAMVIESGIRAADSSVVVKYGTQSVGFDLGFFDILGTNIHTSIAGTDPNTFYEPLSAYRPTTLEILSLFDNDLDLPSFTIDPQVYVVEGGRRDYGTTNRRLTTEIVIEGRGTDFQGQLIQTAGAFDAQAKTLIDITHPFTDDGELEIISMNGIANTDGSSKWKIFRPKLDGTLTLVAEGSIGETPALGVNEVITTDPGPYTEDVSTQDIKVRRGDLLGIFNVDLHTGAYGSVKNDAMYYEIEGDVIGTITPSSPAGAGEAGLPIYARGRITKNKAVVDIDLQRRLNLDTIKIHGFEDVRDLEYNVAVATSSTFSADVPGVHTICYNVNPDLRVCFDRTNTAFNIQALNDDIIFSENGIAGFGDGGPSGLGGADAGGATYFYINGDGEFLGTQEFAGQLPARFEFTRDPYGIDCFFSSSTPRLDKPIGKAIIFFKDKKNQRSWQVETALPGAKGGNGSKPGFQLVPAITAIEIDDKRITSPRGFISTKTASNAQDILLRNPVVLDAVAADGTRNPQLGVDIQFSAAELGGVNTREQVTFHEFQWNRFQWEFDAIRTTGFRYFSDFHWSTKISEFQIFAVSESQESLGDNTQILFSVDGETFTTADLLTADTETAEYKLGGSPQYLRLIFRPTLKLSINDVQVEFEEDQICFGEEGRILGAITVEDARKGTTGAPTPLKMTNSMDQEADLLVDIPVDINSARQLLYFSKLNSAEDIITPDVGSPGRVDFVGDKILREEENVAQNARCHGLVNLASGTGSEFQTTNLLSNAGFENGNLAGWNLIVTQSGTGITNEGTAFGVPSVRNVDVFPDESGVATVFQDGSFVFGAEIDTRIPEHGVAFADNFENIHFELSQTIDISEFANQIDVGTSIANLQFRYITYHSGSNPVLRILGSPTVSGIQATQGTVIDGYGSNLLRSTTLAKSSSIGNPSSSNANLTVEFQSRVPADTRYLKVQLNVTMNDGAGDTLSTFKLMQFWTDEWQLGLDLPAPTKVKWYKNWRTGLASATEFEGWTDSSFAAISDLDFVTITGSTHWYQPFQHNNSTGVPGDGTGGVKVQSPGFSSAFLQNTRISGVQSFRQMTISDPGILGAQWETEREFVGFRIAMHHLVGSSTAFFADAWPISFQVDVLKTEAELGEPPDLNNPNHFRLVDFWRSVDPRDAPNSIQGSPSSSDGPWSDVSTFLLSDGPVSTQGFRVIFTRNCDLFERQTHSNANVFSAITGCPPDNQLFLSDWISVRGVGVGYLVPLASINSTNLPLDNVREYQFAQGLSGANSANTGPTFAAVDLGRHHAIDISTELFELIASTPSQGEWNISSVVYSDDDTDDPNQVVWAGGSSNARWIRFRDSGTSEFEDPAILEIPGASSSTPTIDTIPQGTIEQARIYPDITKTLFPTEGYNSEWVDLGTILSDNTTATFIVGNNYPIIALDLGQKYIIANDSDVVRKRHDVVGPAPSSVAGSIDQAFWIGNDESFWTYANTPSAGSNRPETIPFRTFGAGVPNHGVRWVAVKIADKLQFTPGSGDPPKQYRYNTPGLTLFYIRIKPRSSETFTENSQWFTNRKSTLKDVSSFDFPLGQPLAVVEGTDYGSAAGPTGNSSTTIANNLGDPYRAFDNRFDELAAEFDGWGVQVRDLLTGRIDSNNNFPHSIWRVFRNTQTDIVETKAIKAIKVRGYNEQFYPTDFRFQKLRLNSDGTTLDPNLNSSWETITNAIFNNTDTFQEGFGFTHIFANAVDAKGIRIRISDSVYPDDSIVSDIDPDSGTFQATDPQVSGPQTRVSEVVMYEEVLEDATIQGTIETNHMLSAAVSAGTQVSNHEVGKLKDGNIRSYWQSTGFSDAITISLPTEKPITRLEWDLDPALSAQSAAAGTNSPRNFTLRGVVDGVTQTLVVGSGVENVATFSGTLTGAPVTAKDFTFEITDVQGRQENANSIIISELRLIEVVEQSTPLTVVESSQDRRPNGTNADTVKITYAANADSVAKITADGIDGNNDASWSQRDFFSLWLYVNDINLLDTAYGNIKLGNSSETFYRWDFRNMNLQTGWNELKLQFRTADNISPIEFQPGFQFDENTGDSQVDFLTADVTVTSSVDGTFSQRILQAPGIRFFEIEFRGTRGTEELELILDDFRFVRNKFDDVCKFLPSLYLNNSEAFTIFLEGLDIATGTVEFWFQPDWDTSGRLSGGRSVIPAVFRVMRPDGKFLSLFYRPNQGFIPMIYDGENLLQFVTSISQYRFERFDTFHVALVWDARGRIVGTRGQNATLVLYIDGEPVFGTTESWESVREGGTSVVFGGEVGQRFAATPDNSTSLLFTAVPTQPSKNTASSWALLENLKIYNYAKSDFSDRFKKGLTRTQLINPSEMVEISVSGTGPFYGAGSAELPLSIPNVSPGDSATIYIRTNIPKTLTGDENRDASLLVRWKTPLRDCD